MHLKNRIIFRDKNQYALDFTIKKNYYSISKGKSRKNHYSMSKGKSSFTLFYYSEFLTVFHHSKYKGFPLFYYLFHKSKQWYRVFFCFFVMGFFVYISNGILIREFDFRSRKIKNIQPLKMAFYKT